MDQINPMLKFIYLDWKQTHVFRIFFFFKIKGECKTRSRVKLQIGLKFEIYLIRLVDMNQQINKRETLLYCFKYIFYYVI